MNDEKVVVVKYRPAVKRRRLLLVAACALASLVMSFVLGQRLATDRHDSMLLRYSQENGRLQQLEAQSAGLRQQLVNLERGAEIDRAALQQMRLEIAEARRKNASLGEEIAFYRDLLDPGPEPAGLIVRELTITPQGDSSRYAIRLVIMQSATQHEMITGTAMVTVTGRDAGGADKTYGLNELSQDFDDARLTLHFKYFQSIDGSLELPPGFSPTAVNVSARNSKSSGGSVNATFDWPTAGG